MKQIIILVLFSLALAPNICFAQQGDVYINEGETARICGKYITLDGIWLSGGVRKADVSIRDNENSKPITGGFNNHDTLQVSDKKNCTYFIHDIYKRGMLTKGEIVISTEPAVMMATIMESIVSLNEGDDMYADKKYLVSKISAGKDGAGVVEIKTSREDLDTTVYFKKGDVIWKEGFPFELTEISAGYKTYTQMGKVQTDNHYGFSGSFFANFLDIKNFNLQANAGYDKRGYNDIIIRTDEFGNELGTYHLGWGLNYITAGVTARLKYPLGKITPYVLAGPNIDFYTGYSFTVPSDFPVQDNFSNSTLDNFKKVNYSVSLGAGIEFNKLFPYKTLIEFSYQPPINTSISNAGLNVKEYSYKLKLGIYFNKDKPKDKSK